jgi:lipoyl(octanoyl) transferase
MAVDEALLDDATTSGVATLRLYHWSEPTLSLGYFQRYDDRRQHAASRSCPVVRRQTGGGAILHDRELTYSIVLPPGHPFAQRSEPMYILMHDAFINVLSDDLPAGAPTADLHRNDEVSKESTDSEPFLCFERRAIGDVVTSAPFVTSSTTAHHDWKILGSAQRRSRGALLQHGSLLLERSPAAPELPGLRDLAGSGISVDTQGLVDRVETALKIVFLPADLPPKLQSNAEKLANIKYGAAAWTKRR